MQPEKERTVNKGDSLDALFAPSSVAVIGASRTQGTVGHAVFENILLGGYTGTVYPVNPKAKAISGVRAYPSVNDLPEQVDLGIVIVPAENVTEVAEDCARQGVKGLVVISAGFKEVGGEGVELERELENVVKKHSIRMIGPNCLGIVNTEKDVRLNSSFASRMPMEGSIAVISQSGALCAAILDYASGEKIGFSKFVSMGNKADVTENDLLQYLQHDEQTKVILLYLEDLADGREFIRIATAVTGKKPILAVKAGITPEGARAASSHTGALAGSDEAYDAVFRQSGVLRVESVDELFDYARAFAEQSLPKGNRVAIITNGGGPGIIATDACVRYGLKIAEFSEETKKKLRAGLPRSASVNNPVDVIGDAQADRYEVALRNSLWDPNVDCGLVILAPQAMVDIRKVAQTISEIAPRSGKPLIASLMGIVDVSPGIEILEASGIPHYQFPEAAVRSLATLHNYAHWIERPRTEIRTFKMDIEGCRRIIRKARDAERNLTVREAVQILEFCGFPVAKSEYATDRNEAVRAAAKIGFPVAMKVDSPDILHKYDVGGVRLNLINERDVAESYDMMRKSIGQKMPSARIDGVVIQEQVSGGFETIVGMRRDPKFGPLLMFGLGGIYVEVYKDVAFRLAPIRSLGAQNMITQIRGNRILAGIRGQPPADTEAIAESIERLSQLSVELVEVEEVDINPLLALQKGCKALDARIILSKPTVGQ